MATLYFQRLLRLQKRSSRCTGRSFSTKQDFCPGQFQSPLVTLLWKQRSLDWTKHTGTTVQEVLIPKPPKSARTAITYEFSNSTALREEYTNPFGTIRIGKVLEDMDALAGNIAFEHCDDDDPITKSNVLVTVSVDRIRLAHRPNLKDDMVWGGEVVYTGRSSLQIAMSCCSSWTDKPWIQATFTFVARNPFTGKSIAINPLAPETVEEQARFDAAAARATKRKTLRKAADARVGSEVSDSLAIVQELHQIAASLMERSDRFRLMPCLTHEGNPVLMSQTALQNAFITQPQHRNTANRVFGGFLMRRGFELAFATAYTFMGCPPKFLEIDEVSFHIPVEVGDLLRFKSRVIYTDQEDNTVHVEVVAVVTKPEAKTAAVCDTFYFTFTPPQPDHKLRLVLPETREDADTIANRIIADRYQKESDLLAHIPRVTV